MEWQGAGLHWWIREHAERLLAVEGDRDAALAGAASATAELGTLRGALDHSQKTVLQLQARTGSNRFCTIDQASVAV